MVSYFGLGRWDVANPLEQTTMVVAIAPFEGRVFLHFEGSPWPTPMDHLRLEEAIDRLSQSVIAVAYAADRGIDPNFARRSSFLAKAGRSPRTNSF